MHVLYKGMKKRTPNMVKIPCYKDKIKGLYYSYKNHKSTRS